jgi:NAD(P)H-flavin reductase
VVVRARLGAEYVPVVTPQRRQARLVSRRPLTHDMSEFVFAVDGPAAFRPGQYLLLWLPGVAGARAYSMSNLPNEEGRFELIVKRVPDGAGSGVLFDGTMQHVFEVKNGRVSRLESSKDVDHVRDQVRHVAEVDHAR